MKRLRSLLFAATALMAAAGPAFAVDSEPSAGAPDLAAVRTRIEAGDFKGAIVDLNGLVETGVQHADVYNLLAYSLRQSGDTRTALTYYQKALDFDPDHKGALEYSGELYVQIGDIAKARDNAARLAKLCPQGCEELQDLEQAIVKASVKTN